MKKIPFIIALSFVINISFANLPGDCPCPPGTPENAICCSLGDGPIGTGLPTPPPRVLDEDIIRLLRQQTIDAYNTAAEYFNLITRMIDDAYQRSTDTISKIL